MSDPCKGLVLVAEDDRDLRDIIAAFLDAKGWQVIALAIGPETVAHAWLLRFTAVLLDVRSFTSTGFKVLEQLREIDPTLPVIVLASFGDMSVSRRAHDMGATHVLEKPFDLEELEEALGQVDPNARA